MQQSQTQTQGQVRWEAYDPAGFYCEMFGRGRGSEAAIALIRDRIGPVASFKQAAIIDRLPKTRSGKVLRGTMRSIADSDSYTVPPTIDDPEILGEIETALRTLGYAR